MTLIVRKLGAMCGRPQRERGRPEYNFSLYLWGVTPLGLQQVEKLLGSLSTSESSSAGGMGARPIPPVAAEPEHLPPDVVVSPPDPPSASLKQENELIDLTDVAARETPSTVPAGYAPGTAGTEVPANYNSQVPREESNTLRAVHPLPAVPSAFGPLSWNAALPLESNATFDSLLVGPFNRFAHAAAMAVVSSPGLMYNPLFLHGAPGVGKTHLLFAMARSLEDQAPRGPVFFTTGPLLARAARAAAATGHGEELETRIAQAKALLIDDVHLMAVSESNRESLQKVLKHFFGASKAVVMTSVYPPRVLESLEDALKFQIASGWAVEMKLASGDLQKNVAAAALIRLGFEAQEDDARELLDRLGGEFFDLGRWLRRLGALREILARLGQQPALREIFSLLFVPLGAPRIVAADEIRQALSRSPARPSGGGGASRRLAVFFPMGYREYAVFAVERLRAQTLQYRIPLSWQEAIQQEYDPEQLYGVPFAMGEVCDQARAEAALVVGPVPGSGLADREGELLHALEHILHGGAVPLGWIPFDRIMEDSTYFRVLLDLGSVLGPPS
ncbi:MAG: ATP-binding protein [Elusimicrobia bacterium]|nr:ATP-binding protein [Elusimicrobiota bacterium]